MRLRLKIPCLSPVKVLSNRQELPGTSCNALRRAKFMLFCVGKGLLYPQRVTDVQPHLIEMPQPYRNSGLKTDGFQA